MDIAAHSWPNRSQPSTRRCPSVPMSPSSIAVPGLVSAEASSDHRSANSVADSLNSPELLRRINQLRIPDNKTNWFYLVREYLLIALTIAPLVVLYDHIHSWGISWTLIGA